MKTQRLKSNNEVPPERSLHDKLFCFNNDSYESDFLFDFPYFPNPSLSKNELEPPICNMKSTALSYRPSAVRGDGPAREGYCERCNRWYRLKTSSYWYHMNYKHGISAAGKVCPEPELRERNLRMESYCHECKEWIALGTTRRGVRFGWFKHWQKNHSKSKTI
ncbi:hypothetical protein PAEPH01_0503 [Pancytospora epiphaga]|nr:hypothetical protein PAEPH01_0503 [Pancytospora epiphaga]